MLKKQGNSMAYVLTPDFASCWKQAAAYHLVKLTAGEGKITIDLGLLEQVPEFDGSITLKISCPPDRTWRYRGGQIVASQSDSNGIQKVVLHPLSGNSYVEVEPS